MTSYDEIKAIRSSDLSLIKSNPYLYYLGIRPEIESEALSFGSLVHTLTLEPQEFDKIYAVEEFEGCDLNKNTKAYKEAKKAFLEANEGKEIISKKDYELAKTLSDRARQILSHFVGESEKTFTAKYLDLNLKAKPDFLSHNGILIDLKTISRVDISNDWELARAIKQRAYDRQLAFYKLVLELNNIEINKFYLIFVSKDSQWVRGVELTHKDIELAYFEVDEILSNYSKALSEGFKVKELFNTIELPKY